MQWPAFATPTGNSGAVMMRPQSAAHAPADIHSSQGRIVALDGLRGLMTLFVLVSHYLAEVEHGWNAFECAWVAVQMFFVLSGFLIGRLILEKKHHSNFFFVFYVRRCCRTLPIYLFCIVVVYAVMHAVGRQPYMNITSEFPLWSYLTFTQNVFMAHTGTIGPHWLAPSWTLSVEEQFYLLAPAMFVLTPKRWLLPVLIAGALFAPAFRAAVYWGGVMPHLSALVYLPGSMDSLFCGLITAVIYKRVDVTGYDLHLRLAPLLALGLIVVLKLVDHHIENTMEVFSRFVVSVGCAAYLLAIVRGAPEARSLCSPIFCFFGNTNYAVYLTHIMVLGLMHGLILGTMPDVHTPAQIAVTFAAFPVAIFAGWVTTRYVEEPISAYGRSFAWSNESREQKHPAPVLA